MSKESEDLVPDYDDPKELWAYFGIAFYRANVLEQGVLNMAVGLLAKNAPGITRDQMNSLYDSLNSKTFGQVLGVARKYFEFSDELASDLASALEYRNYLAHGFFVRHDIDLLSESGKRKMIDELVKIASYIKQVDRQMDPIWMSAWEHLGVTREWIAEQMNRYVQERQQEAAAEKSTV